MANSRNSIVSPNAIAICSDRILLVRQAVEHARQIGVTLDVIASDQIIPWLNTHPSSTVLLYLSNRNFNAVVHNCQLAKLSTQRYLLRIVDQTTDDPSSFLGNVCAQVEAPVRDESWKALFSRLQPQTKAIGRGSRTTNETLDFSDEVFKAAHAIANKPVDILLRGETGCGKDKLARFIHDSSGRKGPFIAINCSALPESLAEAELFGSEAGAYTGSKGERIGRLEAAHGGTLYLDEIDSCPTWLQPKLLRALQEKGVERLGSTQFRPSDFRVIASTKVPLPDLVSAGQFRSDLYFRLSVVELELPPLRDCPERILRLFNFAVADAAQRLSTEAPTITSELEAQLLTHTWPGNIRELRAAATRHVLGFSALLQEQQPLRGRRLKDVLDACERSILVSALERKNGCVSRVSSDLSVSLNTLYYRLKRLGISPRGEGIFIPPGNHAYPSDTSGEPMPS